MTEFAGGESDLSKTNIPNPSSPNAWPVAAFLDIDCNRRKTAQTLCFFHSRRK
jgi:hypothetical protein